MLYHLLCQIVEHGGFYRTSDHTWVSIEKIQFVGACNPLTDPGRNHYHTGMGWALIRNVRSKAIHLYMC